MATEFLVTNGIGGYASAEMELGNTRKYHGVLVAADDKLERMMIVNRVLDELVVGGESESATYHLSTNTYKNNHLDPRGHELLTDWSLDNFPTWVFTLKEGSVKKSVCVVPGENATLLRYETNFEKPTQLVIRPLLAYRSFHGVGSNFGSDIMAMDVSEMSGFNYVRIGCPDGKELRMSLVSQESWGFIEEPQTYYDFFYPVEEGRGYDAHEDLFHPGKIVIEVAAGAQVTDILFHYAPAASELKVSPEEVFRSPQISDTTALKLKTGNDESLHDLIHLLSRQASQFTIRVADEPSVIAGYHWFEDWGRDTFISFKGLYLVSERFAEARELLLRWSKLFKGGFLPNRPYVDDYHSIDAVFWYWVGVWEYYQATKDLELVEQVMTQFDGVITAFRQGAQNIEITDEGFILDKNIGTSLTWMDAKIGDYAVTDRSGMAVEIQMLWYNMLKIGHSLKKIVLEDEKFGSPTKNLYFLEENLRKLQKNFRAKFWNESADCLWDLIKPDGPVPGIRPNQVIGLALPFSILNYEDELQILKTAERELLTPVGLRTLNQDHPDYKGIYAGSQEVRDHAYHQGTVWPFLLGHYLLAYLRIHSTTPEQETQAKEYVREKLLALQAKLAEDKLYYIPEIYSADDLRPEGCISQAWSVATLLEVQAFS